MLEVDPNQIEAARHGDRAALERVVRQIQTPLFNLCLRMLADRADAEDANQEILVRIITHLGDLKDTGAAAGWMLKIAMRHLVSLRRKGRVEAVRFTFSTFGEDLEDGLADIPDEAAVSPERAALAAEVKIGCTLALLTCLSRPLRAAYILGEIFAVPDALASEALEIAPDTYRKRLSRARRDIGGFTAQRCGLVSTEAKCLCTRRIDKAAEMGRIGQGVPESHADWLRAKAAIRQLEDGRERTALLMRTNPHFVPETATEVLSALEMAAGSPRSHPSN